MNKRHLESALNQLNNAMNLLELMSHGGQIKEHRLDLRAMVVDLIDMRDDLKEMQREDSMFSELRSEETAR